MLDKKIKEQEIVSVLEIFRDYIAHHGCFDIVFSQKVGYIWFRVQDNDIEGAALIGSAQELLSFLFDEIVYDVMFATSHEHMMGYPTREEQKTARRRVVDILDRAGVDKESYLRLFDFHLKRMGSEALE